MSVEVHLANGLPSLSIVGLPEAVVKESKDRVRAALPCVPARRRHSCVHIHHKRKGGPWAAFPTAWLNDFRYLPFDTM